MTLGNEDAICRKRAAYTDQSGKVYQSKTGKLVEALLQRHTDRNSRQRWVQLDKLIQLIEVPRDYRWTNRLTKYRHR